MAETKKKKICRRKTQQKVINLDNIKEIGGISVNIFSEKFTPCGLTIPFHFRIVCSSLAATPFFLLWWSVLWILYSARCEGICMDSFWLFIFLVMSRNSQKKTIFKCVSQRFLRALNELSGTKCLSVCLWYSKKCHRTWLYTFKETRKKLQEVHNWKKIGE